MCFRIYDLLALHPTSLFPKLSGVQLFSRLILQVPYWHENDGLEQHTYTLVWYDWFLLTKQTESAHYFIYIFSVLQKYSFLGPAKIFHVIAIGISWWACQLTTCVHICVQMNEC